MIDAPTCPDCGTIAVRGTPTHDKCTNCNKLVPRPEWALHFEAQEQERLALLAVFNPRAFCTCESSAVIAEHYPKCRAHQVFLLIANARREALEEAEQRCREFADRWSKMNGTPEDEHAWAAGFCADKIRALKEQTT